MPDETFQPVRTAYSWFDEFKAFAFKGNVVDLAVGVIIGGAFGKIVSSMVDNIIMPLIAVVSPGDKGYQEWAFTLRGQSIPYGKFLGDVLNFLIVAVVLFVFIKKFLGWIGRFRHEEKAQAVPALTKDQEILSDIRDLLRKQMQDGQGG